MPIQSVQLGSIERYASWLYLAAFRAFRSLYGADDFGGGAYLAGRSS
jgi:hypothetical protein